MFSLSRCCLRSRSLIQVSGRFAHLKSVKPRLLASASDNHALRSFSSPPSPDDPQVQYRPEPPRELNLEMAEGIQSANLLILRHGVGNQRLKLLAESDETPLVLKWQRMMEIYLGAQLHVVAALGYETNEQGIMMYTHHLAQFVSTCDPDTQESFRKVGRDTWRGMLATAFDLGDDLLKDYAEEMSIVDARNAVHKVASKLMEPAVLEAVMKRVSELPSSKQLMKSNL
jgi:hypothetical protein